MHLYAFISELFCNEIYAPEPRDCRLMRDPHESMGQKITVLKEQSHEIFKCFSYLFHLTAYSDPTREALGGFQTG